MSSKNYSFPLQLIRCLGVAVLVVTGASAQAQSIEDLRKRLEAPWSAKDWPAAEAIARQIVSQPQSSAADWRNLASVLRLQNKTADAHAARLELIKKPGANSGDYTGVCWYLLEQNRPLEARPACQKAVDLKNDSYAALVNLGHTYLLAGDKAQAMPWYQKTLSNIKKEEELTQGPLDDFNLFIKNNWAVADAQASKEWFVQGWGKLNYLRQIENQKEIDKDQCAVKLPVLVKALEDSDRLLGVDSALSDNFAQRYLSCVDEIAIDFLSKKQDDRAAMIFDSAWQRMSVRSDKEDLWSDFYFMARGQIYRGYVLSGLELYERILRDKVSSLGADHPDTLTSMNNLAFTYGELGQHDKALALREKVLAGRTAKLGADHPDTLTSMNDLAFTYGELGQHGKALALYEKVLAGRTAKLGADHPDTLDSMTGLSLSLYKLKRYTQAGNVLQTLLTMLVKQDGEAKDTTQFLMSMLVISLEAQGQPPSFLQAYKPETQAAVKRLVPATKVVLSK